MVMTSPTAAVLDHERIWLEPIDHSQPFAGDERTWCQDKVWPEGGEHGEPTEYVRADLYADLRARLAAAEGRAVAALEEAQAIVLSMIFMPGVRAALENLPPDDPVEPYLELAKKALTATARVAELEGALKRIAFLRPPGPTKNKLIEEMERIAIDARAGRALGGSNG